MILVIDNYDSFTYNIVQYIGSLGFEPFVIRNDETTINELKQKKFSHIIISPGPGEPDDAGISKGVIKEFAGQVPILGVCLGHQAIGEVFGAKVVRADYLMHGKTSKIYYNDKLFQSLPNPFVATRYHSLVVGKNSVENTPLEITAHTDDNIVMGLKHKTLKNLYGVQFHPESILTENGIKIIGNFLKL